MRGRLAHQVIRRIAVAVARWRAPAPLRRPLLRSTDAALDAALAGAGGMTRSDIFTGFAGNAAHRKRMAATMLYSGADRSHAVARYWDAMRVADQACAACPNVRRCVALLEWGPVDGAIATICPNAGLFAEIARTQPSQGDGPARH